MKTIIVITFLILFSGCSYKKTQSTQSLNLRLQTPKEISIYENVPKVLFINKIKGVNYISTRDFIYSDTNGVYGAYAYHKWDEPLSKQIENILTQTFTQSGLFKSVTTSSSILSYDLVLECNIYDFKHIVDDNTSKVILNIELKIIDVKTKQLINSEIFILEKDTQTVDGKGALQAYNLAIQEFVQNALHWLESSLR
ncbi:ABC-type transport auxiliary lipoprotein family protein [Arcobacter sp. FWKO B]|uniref:ABC-type transport auxiliary lipoprotein family protein n=1 Tax=Arcobacter sp. FWKO B TaxID=2593672 RepID=UPI0018A62664|nr:ABC-type transport auxiliary lipoprotein family protein [Arcobacter sp. FWKO B]QOG13012.1 hypothetical protein FWKOB_10075 [Arcobacter sp. FWKO B]